MPHSVSASPRLPSPTPLDILSSPLSTHKAVSRVQHWLGPFAFILSGQNRRWAPYTLIYFFFPAEVLDNPLYRDQLRQGCDQGSLGMSSSTTAPAGMER